MSLGEFEKQSLNCLKEAVKEVYREAMRDNRKLVVGDYKGNPRLIDASDAFKKRSSGIRIFQRTRATGAKTEKCPEIEKIGLKRPARVTVWRKTCVSISSNRM